MRYAPRLAILPLLALTVAACEANPHGSPETSSSAQARDAVLHRGMDYAKARRIAEDAGYRISPGMLPIEVKHHEKVFYIERPDRPWLVLVWSEKPAGPRHVTRLRLWKDLDNLKGNRRTLGISKIRLSDWAYEPTSR
jgi:hypothetical protein